MPNGQRENPPRDPYAVLPDHIGGNPQQRKQAALAQILISLEDALIKPGNDVSVLGGNLTKNMGALSPNDVWAVLNRHFSGIASKAIGHIDNRGALCAFAERIVVCADEAGGDHLYEIGNKQIKNLNTIIKYNATVRLRKIEGDILSSHPDLVLRAKLEADRESGKLDAAGDADIQAVNGRLDALDLRLGKAEGMLSKEMKALPPKEARVILSEHFGKITDREIGKPDKTEALCAFAERVVRCVDNAGADHFAAVFPAVQEERIPNLDNAIKINASMLLTNLEKIIASRDIMNADCMEERLSPQLRALTPKDITEVINGHMEGIGERPIFSSGRIKALRAGILRSIKDADTEQITAFETTFDSMVTQPQSAVESPANQTTHKILRIENAFDTEHNTWGPIGVEVPPGLDSHIFGFSLMLRYLEVAVRLGAKEVRLKDIAAEMAGHMGKIKPEEAKGHLSKTFKPLFDIGQGWTHAQVETLVEYIYASAETAGKEYVAALNPILGAKPESHDIKSPSKDASADTQKTAKVTALRSSVSMQPETPSDVEEPDTGLVGRGTITYVDGGGIITKRSTDYLLARSCTVVLLKSLRNATNKGVADSLEDGVRLGDVIFKELSRYLEQIPISDPSKTLLQDITTNLAAGTVGVGEINTTLGAVMSMEAKYKALETLSKLKTQLGNPKERTKLGEVLLPLTDDLLDTDNTKKRLIAIGVKCVSGETNGILAEVEAVQCAIAKEKAFKMVSLLAAEMRKPNWAKSEQVLNLPKFGKDISDLAAVLAADPTAAPLEEIVADCVSDKITILSLTEKMRRLRDASQAGQKEKRDVPS